MLKATPRNKSLVAFTSLSIAGFAVSAEEIAANKTDNMAQTAPPAAYSDAAQRAIAELARANAARSGQFKQDWQNSPSPTTSTPYKKSNFNNSQADLSLDAEAARMLNNHAAAVEQFNANLQTPIPMMQAGAGLIPGRSGSSLPSQSFRSFSAPAMSTEETIPTTPQNFARSTPKNQAPTVQANQNANNAADRAPASLTDRPTILVPTDRSVPVNPNTRTIRGVGQMKQNVEMWAGIFKAKEDWNKMADDVNSIHDKMKPGENKQVDVWVKPNGRYLGVSSPDTREWQPQGSYNAGSWKLEKSKPAPPLSYERPKSSSPLDVEIPGLPPAKDSKTASRPGPVK